MIVSLTFVWLLFERITSLFQFITSGIHIVDAMGEKARESIRIIADK